MRASGAFSALRIISIGLILAAIVLGTLQMVTFSRVRAFMAAGLIIADVPVGGLDRPGAAQRLAEIYSLPIELYYGDQLIHLNPSVVDFSLDTEDMLALAGLERTQTQFWQEFWDYLWGRTTFPSQIPLSASYSEARLRVFLAEIAERYDQPAEPALPIPGSVNFEPGKPGTALDQNGAVQFIESALFSLSSRTINLPLRRVEPTRPTFQNIEVLLKQTLQLAEFDGLTGIYLLDLQSAQEIHFAVLDGEDIPVQPDIAFTASSIIKVPIMVSSFSRMIDNTDAETLKLMEDMVDRSGNEAADWLMDRVVDPTHTRGPLVVSDDMQTLGLESTFLAGYFSFGSPLLALYETPGNSREDIYTDPDPYNQTTPSDIGMLLEDIYQCAQSGGGALVAAFPGQIDQTECQAMNTYLINNRLPVLLTAGLPEATPIAHKHGWVTYNGVINTIGDAGIIYSPGGDYILVVFLYHPDQLIWDPASLLIAELSRAVYNFYNLAP
ncbi:serine hydrolase [Chloroflexota bacterium]